MIEVQNLSFSYGHHPVLSHVGFTAQSGECVGILGNNGAGKSTLITCINRIRTPDSGSVLIDGKAVGEYVPPGTGAERGICGPEKRDEPDHRL